MAGKRFGKRSIGISGKDVGGWYWVNLGEIVLGNGRWTERSLYHVWRWAFVSEKMNLHVTLARYGAQLNAENGIWRKTCETNMLQCCIAQLINLNISLSNTKNIDHEVSYRGIWSNVQDRRILSRFIVVSGCSLAPQSPTVKVTASSVRVQLKPDGTRWRTVGEVKGKHASGVGSQ